jgi:hypothetical protein
LDAELEGPDQVEDLLDGVFPIINPTDPIEKIIENCWHGRYGQVADLLVELKAIMGGTTKEQKCGLGIEEIEKSRVCEKYYSSAIKSTA